MPMIAIVSDADHPSFNNLPKELTAKVCVACPVGNLSAKPLPQAAAPITAGIGELWECGIKGPWTDESGKHIK